MNPFMRMFELNENVKKSKSVLTRVPTTVHCTIGLFDHEFVERRVLEVTLSDFVVDLCQPLFKIVSVYVDNL